MKRLSGSVAIVEYTTYRICEDYTNSMLNSYVEISHLTIRLEIQQLHVKADNPIFIHKQTEPARHVYEEG